MPKWYIEANALMDYSNNQKDKTITANDIARFPKADVREVKHGHWRHTTYKPNRSICSLCEWETDEIDSEWLKYCPFCGAKMDGNEEHEEVSFEEEEK